MDRRDEMNEHRELEQLKRRREVSRKRKRKCGASCRSLERNAGTRGIAKPRVALSNTIVTYPSQPMPAHRETSRVVFVAPVECSVLFPLILPVSLARPHHATSSIPT